MPQVTRFESETVQGFLHRPDSEARGDGLVLTHGAGGNCRSALLLTVADAFAQSGTFVLRIDLPFRQQRPFGPPSPVNAARDREGLRRAAEALRAYTKRIFLGGHSYGGRQASILASEDTNAGEGLLLLSYPLHPPKKPLDLRTAHFPKLPIRTLFVHGTSDPFGSIEEVRCAMPLIHGRTDLREVPGAGHDLLGGKFDIESLLLQPFRRITSD